LARGSTWKARDLKRSVYRTLAKQIGHDGLDSMLVFKKRLESLDAYDCKCQITDDVNVLILSVQKAGGFASFPSLSQFGDGDAERVLLDSMLYDPDFEDLEHVPFSRLISKLRSKLKSKRAQRNPLRRKQLATLMNLLQKHDTMVKRTISAVSRHTHQARPRSRLAESLIYDISDSLAEYQREKVLDTSCRTMQCGVCNGQPQVFSESFEIVHAPQVLTLMLERGSASSHARDKMAHKVRYPFREALQLNQLADYQLYGVGVHQSWGTLKSGHYIAYIKSMYNKQWYCANDRSVSRVNRLEDVHSEDATLLMYSKAWKK